MAFRLADVKKTVRSRSDGQRYIHPKLLEGPGVSAQVGLALAYLHARLGRPRREVDPEMLVRFFGDPKVARGLVSCLRHTYRWRAQELADVLEAKDLARLAARDIRTPPDLRLFLYDALNSRGEPAWQFSTPGALPTLRFGGLIHQPTYDANGNFSIVRK